MDTIRQLSADLNAVKAKTGAMPSVHYVDEPVLLRLKKELGHARGSQRNNAKVLGVSIKAFQFVQSIKGETHTGVWIDQMVEGMTPRDFLDAIKRYAYKRPRGR